MAKKQMYKRKFRVPGNTIQDCHYLCKNKIYEHPKPCGISPYKYPMDYSKCLYPSKINQPVTYIVSETIDGRWVCSCPSSIFRKMECDHIKTAKLNPDKYNIPVYVTGTICEIADSL